MINGCVVALDPAEFSTPYSVSWICLTTREWEPQVEVELRRRLRAGDVAFDVGANLGYFSAVMAEAVGAGGEVAAFEPMPSTFRRLEATQRWNTLKSMRAFNLAIGDHSGTVPVWHTRSSSALASMSYREAGSRQHEVALETLDNLVAEGIVRPPTLIKIDVEGHELGVLQGAVNTIQAHRPDLIFEINPQMSRRAGWSFADVRRLLVGVAPYSFHVLGTGEGIDVGDLDVIGDHVDVVAHAPRS
jgi:FkbM family methyltransferase